MRKLVVVLMMSLYSLGNVLFPGVDMTHLRDMYAECSIEDPDINAADFVFEHLLNIPEPGDDDETEKPHQSTYTVSAMQVAAVVSKPQMPELRPIIFPEDRDVFIGYAGLYLPTGFSGRILRPPIV